jgi:hypothetical protein
MEPRHRQMTPPGSIPFTIQPFGPLREVIFLPTIARPHSLIPRTSPTSGATLDCSQMFGHGFPIPRVTLVGLSSAMKSISEVLRNSILARTRRTNHGWISPIRSQAQLQHQRPPLQQLPPLHQRPLLPFRPQLLPPPPHPLHLHLPHRLYLQPLLRR